MLSKRSGITLIELLVVLAIMGILASISVGVYTNSVHRARIAAAFTEIRQLEMACERYRLDLGMYPPSSSGTRIAPASLDQNLAGVGCGYMTVCLLKSLSGTARFPLDPRWNGPYLELDEEQLGTLDNSTITVETPLPQIQMLDPWGYPYYFVNSDEYTSFTATELPTDDPYYATDRYYNVSTFQIVSLGLDGESAPRPQLGLELDDVTNFTR